MATFRIDETWLDHGGGTKFYHPIRVQMVDGGVEKVVSVIHFAAYSGDFTKFRRPVRGGQVQITRDDRYRKQIDSKRRNGYEQFEPERSKSFNSFVSFERHLVEMLGAADASEVIVGLGLDREGELAESHDAPLSPSAGADHTPIERPAEWGSW